MWPWFHQFMGGIRFKNYIATFVTGTVTVEDKNHPAMKDITVAFRDRETKSGTPTTHRRARTCTCWRAWTRKPTHLPPTQDGRPSGDLDQRARTRPETSTSSWATVRSILRQPGVHPDLYEFYFLGRWPAGESRKMTHGTARWKAPRSQNTLWISLGFARSSLERSFALLLETAGVCARSRLSKCSLSIPRMSNPIMSTLPTMLSLSIANLAAKNNFTFDVHNRLGKAQRNRPKALPADPVAEQFSANAGAEGGVREVHGTWRRLDRLSRRRLQR